MSQGDPRSEMERYRAGEMSGAEKRRFEEQVLHSAELSDELYDDVSLENSILQTSRRSSRGIPRVVTWLVPVAAAALLVLAVQLRGPDSDDPPVMRGSGAGVELISPQGSLEHAPDRFQWRRHPDAHRYRFELLDAEAHPLIQVVVADTFWSPVEEDPPIPAAGSWHITPLDDLMMDLGEGSSASYRLQH